MAPTPMRGLVSEQVCSTGLPPAETFAAHHEQGLSYPSCGGLLLTNEEDRVV